MVIAIAPLRLSDPFIIMNGELTSCKADSAGDPTARRIIASCKKSG